MSSVVHVENVVHPAKVKTNRLCFVAMAMGVVSFLVVKVAFVVNSAGGPAAEAAMEIRHPLIHLLLC